MARKHCKMHTRDAEHVVLLHVALSSAGSSGCDASTCGQEVVALLDNKLRRMGGIAHTVGGWQMIKASWENKRCQGLRLAIKAPEGYAAGTVSQRLLRAACATLSSAVTTRHRSDEGEESEQITQQRSISVRVLRV